METNPTKTEGWISFCDRPYKVREIDLGKDWGTNLVASERLGELLDCSRNTAQSEFARYVDEKIFFFIPRHWFKLSDQQLQEKILRQII